MPEKKSSANEQVTQEPDVAEIELEAVVICDDVRREINGKAILIGIYDGIIVGMFPAELLLACWMQIKIKKPGKFHIKIRMMGPHDVNYGETNLASIFPQAGLTSVGIGGMYAPIQTPGDLNFEMSLNGGEWKHIKRIEVAKSAEPIPVTR